METSQSHFRINQARRLFCVGPGDFPSRIAKSLASLDFLVPTPMEKFDPQLPQPYVVIVEVDFGDTRRMQAAVYDLERRWTPLAYKILYAKGDQPLHHPFLLFGVEAGAQYTGHGPDRDQQIKERIKKWAIDSQENVTYTAILEEIERCYQLHDREGLMKVGQRLGEMGRQNEEVLRLQVICNQRLNRPNRVEFFLKEILRQNPQSLWAANQLGRYYIENQQIAQGIEVLEKLSHFHNLSGERLLTLGNAYLNAGVPEKARETLEKGDALNQGRDHRFKEGLQKADLLLVVRDEAGSVLFDGKPLSREVLSFLNMRAIMAVKNGQFDEGHRFYQYALQGAGVDKVLEAKLCFNQGLAYVRSGDIPKAQASFQRSVTVGGEAFPRASKPLAITTKLARKNETTDVTPNVGEEIEDLLADDFQWERVS